jgi:hypothetical protein
VQLVGGADDVVRRTAMRSQLIRAKEREFPVASPVLSGFILPHLNIINRSHEQEETKRPDLVGQENYTTYGNIKYR